MEVRRKDADGLLGDTQSLATNLVVGGLGIGGLGGIKAPDTTGLFTFQVTRDAKLGRKLLEERIVILLFDTVEEAALPFTAFGLLSAAQLTLGILDAGLVSGDSIHVTTLNVLSNLLPGTSALVKVLLFNGGQVKWGSLIVVHDPLVNNLLGAGILDGEGIRPLSIDGVERLLLAFTGLVQACGEGVLLSAQPALAGEVDLCDVAAAADDLGGLFELHEGSSVDERFDVQVGQGDHIFFLLAGPGWGESVLSMSELLHLNSARERGLLGVISLELMMRTLLFSSVLGHGEVACL